MFLFSVEGVWKMMSKLQYAAKVEMPFKVKGVCDAQASGNWYVWNYAISEDRHYKAVSIGSFVCFLYVMDDGTEFYYPELTLRFPLDDHRVTDMAVASHRFAVLVDNYTLHIWTQKINVWKKEPVYPLGKNCKRLWWADGCLMFRSSDDVYYAFIRRWLPLFGYYWWPRELPVHFPMSEPVSEEDESVAAEESVSEEPESVTT